MTGSVHSLSQLAGWKCQQDSKGSCASAPRVPMPMLGIHQAIGLHTPIDLTSGTWMAQTQQGNGARCSKRGNACTTAKFSHPFASVLPCSSCFSSLRCSGNIRSASPTLCHQHGLLHHLQAVPYLRCASLRLTSPAGTLISSNKAKNADIRAVIWPGSQAEHGHLLPSPPSCWRDAFHRCRSSPSQTTTSST